MGMYRCIRDCFFQDRYHHAGRDYDFPDDVEVPRHFAAQGSKEADEAEPAPVDEGPKTMHEMAKAKAKVAEPPPKGGAGGKKK